MVDYFLQITGIEGESTDAKHKGWLDVESWSWGESQTPAAAVGAGGGAGRVQMQDATFMTRMTKASPKLFLACAAGTHVKEAKLAAVRTGATQLEFLTWTLSDVLVTSYQTSAGGDEVPTDAVSLNFGAIRVEYKAQKPDGSLDAPVTAAWDAKSNKKL